MFFLLPEMSAAPDKEQLFGVKSAKQSGGNSLGLVVLALVIILSSCIAQYFKIFLLDVVVFSGKMNPTFK